MWTAEPAGRATNHLNRPHCGPWVGQSGLMYGDLWWSLTSSVVNSPEKEQVSETDTQDREQTVTLQQDKSESEVR